MKPSFRLSNRAEQELNEILEYILANHGARRARRLEQQLSEACFKLSEFPGMGHRRDDLADESLRVWTVFSYLII